MSRPDKVAFLNELADLMDKHGVVSIDTRDEYDLTDIDFEFKGSDILPMLPMRSDWIRDKAKGMEGSQ